MIKELGQRGGGGTIDVHEDKSEAIHQGSQSHRKGKGIGRVPINDPEPLGPASQ